MNTLNIDEMPAGREMDALVAEKVMGWTWDAWKTGEYPLSPYKGRTLHDPSGLKAGVAYLEDYVFDVHGHKSHVKAGQWIDAHYWPGGEAGARKLPDYSTDIAAAWEVVEKLQELLTENKCCTLRLELSTSGYAPNEPKYKADFVKGSRWIEGRAETMPLAICRAALKAVGA